MAASVKRGTVPGPGQRDLLLIRLVVFNYPLSYWCTERLQWPATFILSIRHISGTATLPQIWLRRQLVSQLSCVYKSVKENGWSSTVIIRVISQWIVILHGSLKSQTQPRSSAVKTDSCSCGSFGFSVLSVRSTDLVQLVFAATLWEGRLHCVNMLLDQFILQTPMKPQPTDAWHEMAIM